MGSTNFIVLGVMSLVLGGEYAPRQILLTAMLIVSRLWLAAFLLYRVLQRGKDDRFDEFRSNFWAFLGFWVFQMIWAFGVSLPVIYVNSRTNNPPLEARDWIGLAMFGAFPEQCTCPVMPLWLIHSLTTWFVGMRAVVGLYFEVAGDLQKTWFRTRPDSRGRYPSDGVFAMSRHPNYFGEIFLWWGVFVTATPALEVPGNAAGWATIMSPILTMIILLFLSGMPSAEGEAQRKYMKTRERADEYRAYRERTSPVIPFPAFLYVRLPLFIKRVLFLELPMYETTYEPSEGSDAENSDIKNPVGEHYQGAVAAASAAAAGAGADADAGAKAH